MNVVVRAVLGMAGLLALLALARRRNSNPAAPIRTQQLVSGAGIVATLPG